MEITIKISEESLNALFHYLKEKARYRNPYSEDYSDKQKNEMKKASLDFYSKALVALIEKL